MLKQTLSIPKKILAVFIAALFLVSMLFFALPGKLYANGAPVEVWVDDSYTTEDSTHFKTISGGINAVALGGTVHVAAGTYNEDITMNKPVNLIGTAGETLIKGTITIEYTHDSLSASIKDMKFLATDGHSIILKKAKNTSIVNCHFDGAGRFMNSPSINAIEMPTGSSYTYGVTIEKCTFENGYYVTIDGYAANLTVKDSKIKNVKSGINVQVGDNLVVENTDISVIAQGLTNDTYCVRFADGNQSSANMTIKGGTFSVNKNNLIAGSGTYHSAIIIRSKATGTLKANGLNIYGEVVNLSSAQLDATGNWWGSATGPEPGTIIGNVSLYPWLTNPVGYVPPAPPKPLTPEEQAALDLSIEKQVAVYGASNVGFTKTLYDNILGRAADEEGLNAWVTALNEGRITLKDLVFGFVFSKELEPVVSPAGPEEFITFLYKNVFNRDPDPDGFNNWLTHMQNGMTKEEVLLHFVDSEEFNKICEMFGL